MYQPKVNVPEELQTIVYQKFSKLPLENKLVVYARLVHGNMFKAQNNDLFGLNRRIVSKIYRSFIDSLKEGCGVKRSTNRTNSRYKK
jgi:hypothetical protein